MEPGCRGSQSWPRVGGRGVSLNTTLSQGVCAVQTQGEPCQWVYASNVLQVVWPLQVQDKEGCSPSHLRHILALGGIGAGRVVEPQADGAAIFCPVVGMKGRARFQTG